MRFSKWILAVLVPSIVSATGVVQAVEIDDITAYYAPVQDSTPILNGYVNRLLREAADEVGNCDPAAFESAVLSRLTPKGLVSRTFFGGVELYAQKAPEIDRVSTPLDQSIYKGSPLERATLVVAGRLLRIGDIFPSIRLNGIIVGTDKLSHFFETGHELFSAHLRGRPLDKDSVGKLIDASVELEDGHLGMSVTGIKSYADAQSHFQGALFWLDVLSSGSKWWSCESGRIRVAKTFDFADVVSEGWSEAINCNEYSQRLGWSSMPSLFGGSPPPPYESTVRANMAALEAEHGRRYQCPIEPEGCERARSRLKKLLPEGLDVKLESLMSPICGQKHG